MKPTSDTDFLRAVADVLLANPFRPGRVDAERRALGDAHEDRGRVWSFPGEIGVNPNLEAIDRRLEELIPRLAADAREREQVGLAIYRDAAIYLLYNRWQARLLELIERVDGKRPVRWFPEFLDQATELLYADGLHLPQLPPPRRLFAWFFQVRRAFHFTFRTLIGRSPAAAELRAAVWESVFTHDMGRYRAGLFRSMGDMTTLITGPSGTGKELIARAIGLSRYIPFDPESRSFLEDPREAFFPVNLSALSPTLIESELFGHQRGSFTGAIKDHPGWFEVCPTLGAVFLDEVGEVDEAIQVKLLRVLQTRTFQRIGDTRERQFKGKLIAATNRDPAQAIADGRLREDFFYRICSDQIRTPPLRAHLADDPDELDNLVAALIGRLFRDDDPAASSRAPSDAPTEVLIEPLQTEVVQAIRRGLGDAYPWPGNFRELEQCIRSVVLRGRYEPAVEADPSTADLRTGPQSDPLAHLRAGLERAELSADDVLTLYTAHAHRYHGNYVATARALGIDRRTVKARVEAAAATSPSTMKDGDGE